MAAPQRTTALAHVGRTKREPIPEAICSLPHCRIRLIICKAEETWVNRRKVQADVGDDSRSMPHSAISNDGAKKKSPFERCVNASLGEQGYSKDVQSTILHASNGARGVINEKSL